MSSGNADAPSPVSLAETDREERRRVAWVFAEWCLRREASQKSTYSLLLLPLFFAGVQCSFVLQLKSGTGVGRELFQALMWGWDQFRDTGTFSRGMDMWGRYEIRKIPVFREKDEPVPRQGTVTQNCLEFRARMSNNC